MTQSPRAIGHTLVAAIERGFAERGLAGRWSVFFPPTGGDFEIQGEGLRLIVEINYGIEQTGLARAIARAFKQGPVQARLRAWFLNEFVERIFDDPAEVAPVL
ncbi:MAG: hypothetical protein NZ518_11105, partial [Dehalococcoidia bacterium]|nr:hypothetical protein [Dehalococcoidia bacterium]